MEMEPNSIRRTLFEVCRTIFEDAAFTFVDMPDETGAIDPGMTLDSGDIAAEVDFAGPFNGLLAVSTCSKMAVNAAANMLGVDEDDPSAGEKKSDALCELLNMICGNFLPAVAGAEPEFRIGSPRIISTGEFKRHIDNEQMPGAAAIQIVVEGCLTDVVFFVDDRKV